MGCDWFANDKGELVIHIWDYETGRIAQGFGFILGFFVLPYLVGLTGTTSTAIIGLTYAFSFIITLSPALYFHNEQNNSRNKKHKR